MVCRTLALIILLISVASVDAAGADSQARGCVDTDQYKELLACQQNRYFQEYKNAIAGMISTVVPAVFFKEYRFLNVRQNSWEVSEYQKEKGYFVVKVNFEMGKKDGEKQDVTCNTRIFSKFKTLYSDPMPVTQCFLKESGESIELIDNGNSEFRHQFYISGIYNEIEPRYSYLRISNNENGSSYIADFSNPSQVKVVLEKDSFSAENSEKERDDLDKKGEVVPVRGDFVR